MSVVSDKTLKGELGKIKGPSKPRHQDSEDRRSCKRDSRNTIGDDETTTDWIPEIPFFWNVSLITSYGFLWIHKQNSFICQIMIHETKEVNKMLSVL